MNLRLPSGAVVSVEPPRLRAVLRGNGSTAALIEAVWAHEMEQERLQECDADFLATWCVRRLPDDPEAEAFTTACLAFGEAPSRRLHIVDPLVAFACDNALLNALEPVETPSSDEEDEEQGHDG